MQRNEITIWFVLTRWQQIHGSWDVILCQLASSVQCLKGNKILWNTENYSPNHKDANLMQHHSENLKSHILTVSEKERQDDAA